MVLVNRTEEDVDLVMSDRKSLLSVNRFEKKKGIGLAVETFALLRRQHSDMRLVLAGIFSFSFLFDS